MRSPALLLLALVGASVFAQERGPVDLALATVPASSTWPTVLKSVRSVLPAP